MAEKEQPSAAIPLEELLKGGRRNLDHLERERPRLERMQWDDAMLSKLPRAQWEATRAAARDAIRMHDALRDALHSNATANLEVREKQSKRAKAPRVVGDDGRTVKDVVQALARAHPGVGPRELWTHLPHAIREWARGECVSTERDIRYDHPRGDGTRTLSFKTFSQYLTDSGKK